ncbi:MAG TPA: hypothetical protein VGC42_27170 [Kofleriaceae bacterium]
MSNSAVNAKRWAIYSVVGFVVAYAAFYLLSDGYFASHQNIIPGQGKVAAYAPAQIAQVRVAFGVFAGVIAVASFLAGTAPRLIGHLLALGLGALHLVFGVYAATSSSATAALWMSLFITGVLLPVLAHFSYRQRSRPAWAFLISICGVFAVVEFFGAPKVRGALDISLWTTMIFPGLNLVAVTALVSLRNEYLDRPARGVVAAAA